MATSADASVARQNPALYKLHSDLSGDRVASAPHVLNKAELLAEIQRRARLLIAKGAALIETTAVAEVLKSDPDLYRDYCSAVVNDDGSGDEAA